MKKVLFLVLSGLSVACFAQKTFVTNGVADNRPQLFLLSHGTVHYANGTVSENTDIIVENGLIKDIGSGLKTPQGAVVQDLKGRHVYPSFIDAYSNFSMPEVRRSAGGGFRNQQLETNTKGAFAANQAIKPEVDAAKLYVFDSKQAEEYRKIGFGMASIHNMDGLMRGTGAIVNFKSGKEHESLVKAKATAHFSINKGTSTQVVPVSKMGALSVIRQTLYDADWYSKGGQKSEYNLSLEAINNQKNLVMVYDAEDKLDVLRAASLGQEFGINFLIKTQGDEYQRLDDIKALNASLIVPLVYPAAYDVEDPFDAQFVQLSEMKHWEMAPANAGFLQKAGINFSLTTAGLKSKGDFLANLRKAIEYGLSETAALAALTIHPAKALKIDHIAGNIEKGKHANLLICTDNVFSKDNIIVENWVSGEKYLLNDQDLTDVRGSFQLKIGDENYKMTVTGKVDKPDYQININDSTKVSPKVTRSGDLFSVTFKKPKDAADHRLSGYFYNGNFEGKGENAQGKELTWQATRTEAFKAEATKKDTSSKKIEIGKINYPFGAFGSIEKPKSENLLFKNTTVWTNEAVGILNETDVLIQNGKIAGIGKNLSAPAGTKVIDGTGKHFTNGIFDEHSHIGLQSINESQSVSSEVRMYDVLDADDVDFYRQLAGGTTSAQLLHGSANCIGGQSALVKFKWGEAPEGMKIKNAPGFIKFALGENVKQASAQSPVRFPASRMGVEQVMFDAFFRAKDYQKAIAAYNALSNKTGITPPRKDLELDALVEILNSKRFITCHSYVQSEINMLMKVADSCGFKINTFTHILEGYKVADKMKAHGVNASSFSDWWAYKMEVKEAIPHNAAILTKMGVNTCINSDDAEMARRLNQEAAKTVLYGGISEIEAWKMVTLNPAKAFHLDDKMGSIKMGKEADVVLWDANPLSIYAKPVYTIIDGAIYFSQEKDQQLREQNHAERTRLTNKMLAEKSGGAPTTKPSPKKTIEVHCDTQMEEELAEEDK